MGGFCEAGGGDDAGGDDAVGGDSGAIDAPPGIDAPGGSDAMTTSSACGTLSLLRDDFATAGDGPLFDSFNAANVTIAESAGRLVIDLAPGQDGYGGYESFYLYDFHGGEIVTQVVETSADNTILEVRNDAGNKAQLVEQNGQISAALYNVPSPGVLATRTWNTSETFWRIREDMGDMVWETSADRQTWTLVHRRTLPFDVSHVHGIVAAGGTVSTLSRSSFEQINPDVTSSLYCPADMLRDDFTTAGTFYPRWYIYQNAGCTLTKSGGNAVMTWQTGSTSSFCGMNGSHLYDLSRGMGITVDANTFPSTANFNSYVNASDPAGTNRVEMELDGATLYLRLVANNATVSSMNLTFNRPTHRWWRMRGEGTAAIWETAPDGTTWTERHRATASFPLTGLDINIGAGRYGNITATQTITLPGVNAN